MTTLTTKQAAIIADLKNVASPGDPVPWLQLFDALDSECRSEVGKAQMVLRLVRAGTLRISLPAGDPVTTDVAVLRQVASGEEEDVLDDLMIRAGLMSRCSVCGWNIHPADGPHTDHEEN